MGAPLYAHTHDSSLLVSGLCRSSRHLACTRVHPVMQHDWPAGVVRLVGFTGQASDLKP